MEASGTLALVRDGEQIHSELPLGNVYQTQIQAFTYAVEHDRATFHASAADGIRSVALTEALVESARDGLAVRPRL
jgi:predicted dehydrogenase